MKHSFVYRLLLMTFMLLCQLGISAQCTNGSQPECTCETAEILCSSDELNGYSGSMSSFSHPGDGPSPFCGGQFSDNPNWFGFVAWCTELTLEVEVSNCVGAGVQMALFTDCTFNEQVECDLNCNAGTTVTLDLNLEIGEDYFLMIDGCTGAYCDYEVTVSPLDCDETIEDWPNPMDGDFELCVGDQGFYDVDELIGAINYHWFIDGVEVEVNEDNFYDVIWNNEGVFELCVDVSNACVPVDDPPDQLCAEITVYIPELDDWQNPIIGDTELCVGEGGEYEIDALDGATGYHWTIDGVEIEVTDDPMFSFVWNTAGEFELCVDASSNCVDVSDNPDPTCIDVIVFEPEAGDIFVDPDDDLCPGEIATISIFDYSTESGLETVIVVSNGDEDIVEIFPPDEAMITNNDCETITVCSYTYITGEGPMLGDNISDLICFESCCDLECIEVSFEDTDMPEFQNAPPDLMLDCFDDLVAMEDLDWIDDCDGMGTVMGSESGDANLCDGGLLVREWTYTDGCGNVGIHTQNINIDASPQPIFSSMPADYTTTCDMIPDSAPDLEVVGNGSGACSFMDVVSPTMDGDADMCGGSINFTWSYNDPCGNMIMHTQVATVEPASEPTFVNPPMDMTIACSEPNVLSSSLTYSNNDNDCLIEGAVMSTIDDQTNECGGNIMVTWAFTDVCDRMIEHTQIITMEPPGQAAFLSLPADMTISCNDPVPSFTTLDYSNGEMDPCLISGSVAPVIDDNLNLCGGTITATWTFTDACGRTIDHVQEIEREPAPEPQFANPPMDMTMSCVDFESFSPVDLMFTNSAVGLCLIEGSVPGNISGQIDECGGVAEVLYEYTDDCGRTIMYVQTVTVEPAPVASFTNLPMNMTLSCIDVNTPPGPLSYSNNSSGTCLISGAVDPIQAGAVDECGGTINYIYTFTDDCNRTISHTQVITYSPAADPVFIDPPEDGIIGCEEELPDDLSLEYDNFESSPCAISGEVDPEITQVGNIITLVWNYTNDCTGNTISHTQMYEQSISVNWEEELLTFEICSGDAFDLSSIMLVDLNNSAPTITYHSGFPVSSGNQISDPMVMPTTATSYFIWGTNSYGCTDFVEVSIEPENVTVAGSDNSGIVCVDEQFMDLYDFVSEDGNLNGDFFQISGPTLNISDPDDVNIGSAMAGMYEFEYTIAATDVCPSSTAIISVELLPAVSVSVVSVSCSMDFQTYIVEITNDDYDVDINAGSFFDYSVSAVTIGDIPIGTVLEIDLTDINTDCENEIMISPPNCDCPDVEAPVSNGDEVICFGEQNPTLSVTLSPGTTANWYDAEIGGSLVLANSSQFTPTDMAPGLYIYYVDAESLDNPGCLSDIRIPVSLEILSAPDYSQMGIEICDEDADGIVVLDSLDLQGYLNISPTETITYYPSLSDAEAGINDFEYPITNSTPFNFSFFAEVANSADCATIFPIDLSVFAKPEIDLLISDVTCIGAMDGSIAIQDYDPLNEYFLDGDMLTEAAVMNMSQDTYEFIMSDVRGCRDTLEFEILEGLSLDIISFTWVCSDNGTNTDPNDDFYQIDFVVNNNQNNMGSFSVIDDNSNVEGPFTYGMASDFVMNADGSSQVLMFVDDASGCAVEMNVGPLVPCSTDCIISVDQLDFECNDGGTPTIADDDFYELTINASAINGSMVDLYNVAVNGVISYSFPYGQSSSFQLPADGTIYTIGVSDAEDLACTLNESVGPLESCSDDCVLDAMVSDLYCDNNDTGEIADDDVFYFNLFVEGVNVSANYTVSGLNIMGSYDQEIELGPFLVVDGDLDLIIADELDPNCTVNINVMAPGNCSDCPQTMDAGLNVSLSCTEPGVMLMANASEDGDFNWEGPGDFMFDGLNPEVTEAGTYYLTAQFSNGCILIDSVMVLDIQMPTQIDATIIDVACSGDSDGSIMINEVVGGTPPYDITIDGVDVVGDFMGNLGPGNYDVSLTDANGCVLETVLTIEAGQVLDLDLPPSLDLGTAETGMLEATTNLAEEDIESIQWVPAEGMSCDTCLITEISEPIATAYTITLTSLEGCVASATISISTEPEEGLIIPNVFSPNNDGNNDFFTIFSGEKVALINSVLIYDRWGELVYEAYGVEPNVAGSGWDGRFNGSFVSAGVYIYSINYELQSGAEETMVSDVTVLR